MRIVLCFIWFYWTTEVNCDVNSSSDLNCDFSTECQWRNGTNGEEDSGGDFVPGFSLQMDEFHRITSLRADRDDNFVYSFAIGGRHTSLLISDVINCQLGGASLKYWYWKTGFDVLMDVCIRQPPGSRDPVNLKCFDGLSSTHAQQWIFRSVELPPISQPFEIVIRTTFTAPLDLIALDDIQYDAILCESSSGGSSEGAGGGFGPPDPQQFISPSGGVGLAQPTFFGNELSLGHVRNLETVKRAPTLANLDPPHSPFDDNHFGYSRASAAKTYDIPSSSAHRPTTALGPRKGAQFASRCPPIDCDFDDHSFCEYITSITDVDLLSTRSKGDLRDWALSNQRVENTLTGIPHDLSRKGGFLFAGDAKSPSDQFVLSSRTPLQAPAATRLDFFVYLAGVAGRLRVCFDSLINCPFAISGKQIDISSRQWNNYFVTVPEGSHTIHFVADRLKKNYVIGLDNIQLLSKYGMSSQPC